MGCSIFGSLIGSRLLSLARVLALSRYLGLSGSLWLPLAPFSGTLDRYRWLGQALLGHAWLCLFRLGARGCLWLSLALSLSALSGSLLVHIGCLRVSLAPPCPSVPLALAGPIWLSLDLRRAFVRAILRDFVRAPFRALCRAVLRALHGFLWGFLALYGSLWLSRALRPASKAVHACSGRPVLQLPTAIACLPHSLLAF